jgi:SAM-dependent methyltransferase
MNKTAKTYFSTSDEVLSWWQPQNDLCAQFFEYALNKTKYLLLKDAAAGKVLEAGFGHGRVSFALANHFAMTCIDISPFMVKRQSSIKRVMLETLVHIENTQETFIESNRLLRNGGLLIFNFDNRNGFLRRLKNIFERIIALYNKTYRIQRLGRFQRYYPCSLNRISKELQKANLHIEEIEFYGLITPFKIGNRIFLSRKKFDLHAGVFNYLNNLRLLKSLSTFVLIKCKKA